MSLIEDLSNPLSRLIVYLCLSLIGLKRELSPWSIQRREKSNHFSLCLSVFVYVFLPSSFCCGPFPSYCLFLCLPFSLFLCFAANPHIFILSTHLSPLSCFSSPNTSFSSSVLSLSGTPIFFFLPLEFFSISFGLLLASIFSALQTSCNEPYIKSETVSSPEGAAWFGKSQFYVHIFRERQKKPQLVQTQVSQTNMTLEHF